jgi:hypothetical protein
MTQTGSGWQETFQAEFLEKQLVTFEQCAFAFATMDVDHLLAEMALLISPRMRAVPFASSGRRYYALMDALVRRVGDTPGIADAARARLINVCIDLVEYVRRQTPPGSRDDFARALAATLDSVDLFGRYPQVAQCVADGTRDYKGGFRENEIGDILSAAE